MRSTGFQTCRSRRPCLEVIEFDVAAEADLEGALAALELPRIAVLEPGFGKLDLPAVGDFLAEHAVGVADAVAVRRNADGRHAFHEAGGEPARGRHCRAPHPAPGRRSRRVRRRATPSASRMVPEGRDWRTRPASAARSGIRATGSRRAFPGGRRPPWSNSIHWSMMRSRTTLIDAVSQSWGVATVASLPTRYFRDLEDFGRQRFGIGCFQDRPWEFGCHCARHVASKRCLLPRHGRQVASILPPQC